MSRYSPRARLTNTISTAAVANWFGNQFVIVPGSFESIATVTAASNGSSTTLTFSDIPQTYTHLQIRGISRATAAGSATIGLLLQCNSDTGTNYTSSHVVYGNGTSALAAGSSASQTSISVANYPYGGATTNAFGVMVLDILDYANTNKYKTIRSLNGYEGNDTNGIVTVRSGAWMSTSAITSITIDRGIGTNFAQYTTFALYGIKGA